MLQHAWVVALGLYISYYKETDFGVSGKMPSPQAAKINEVSDGCWYSKKQGSKVNTSLLGNQLQADLGPSPAWNQKHNEFPLQTWKMPVLEGRGGGDRKKVKQYFEIKICPTISFLVYSFCCICNNFYDFFLNKKICFINLCVCVCICVSLCALVPVHMCVHVVTEARRRLWICWLGVPGCEQQTFYPWAIFSSVLLLSGFFFSKVFSSKVLSFIPLPISIKLFPHAYPTDSSLPS